MDVKIAVITGAAFAGVLVAGALAAPRGGGHSDDPQDSAGGPTSIINTGPDGNFVLESASFRGDDDDEREDDDEHEEHERRERGHDDDDHEDDD